MNRIIPVIIALSLASCGRFEEEQNLQPAPEENPYANWVEHSLQPFGMDVALKVPGPLNNAVEIRRNDNFGRIEFSAGESVDFIITGDFESVNTRKFDLESGIFSIEYVEDSPDFILYKAMLPDGSSPYFNFVKVFEYRGEKYSVENNPLVEFSEDEVRLMAGIVDTMEPK